MRCTLHTYDTIWIARKERHLIPFQLHVNLQVGTGRVPNAGATVVFFCAGGRLWWVIS